jgi:anti-sigma B factor antagonist
MSAKINVRHLDGVSILDVSGRITLGEGSVGLRDAVHKELEAGNRKIVLNLANVSYMDSSGVGELTSAYSSVKHQGGEIRLVNLTKKVDGLMQITKLATVFDISSDESTAIASFQG